jgi:5,10-methylenetetrahydrofolate reductase
MPIVSLGGMVRMAELASRARFPAPLLSRVYGAASKDEGEESGGRWATDQVADLLKNGVRGVHFYTLNNAKATLRIYEALGMSGGTPPGHEAGPARGRAADAEGCMEGVGLPKAISF